MDPYAAYRLSGVQYPGTAFVDACRIGYVQAKSRMEVCKEPDAVIFIYGAAGIYQPFRMHTFVVDSGRFLHSAQSGKGECVSAAFENRGWRHRG